MESITIGIAIVELRYPLAFRMQRRLKLTYKAFLLIIFNNPV